MLFMFVALLGDKTEAGKVVVVAIVIFLVARDIHFGTWFEGDSLAEDTACALLVLDAFALPVAPLEVYH